MTYRLVFDVGQQIPEIAVGICAAIVALGVIAAGLWAFDDTVKAWRLVVAATLALASALLLIEQSRSLYFPIGFALIATTVDVLRDRVEALRQLTVPRGAVTTVASTFLLVFIAGSGLGRFGAIDLVNELNAGKADVLEGSVEAFSEVALKSECFTLEGRRFCYADSVVAPGFTRTRTYGGPIEPGLRVRVAAIRDTIVRLEIAQP